MSKRVVEIEDGDRIIVANPLPDNEGLRGEHGVIEDFDIDGMVVVSLDYTDEEDFKFQIEELEHEDALALVEYIDEANVKHVIGQVWTTGTLDEDGEFIADGIKDHNGTICWSLAENAFSELTSMAKKKKWKKSRFHSW